MKFEIMAVYDSKARAYCTPFYVSHLAVGIRTFADAVNDPVSHLAKNPDDYTLYHLGEWDDGSGNSVLFPEHKNLGLATKFMR